MSAGVERGISPAADQGSDDYGTSSQPPALASAVDGQPSGGQLPTGRVMRAALQVVDTEGLEALTMQHLWEVLDHNPLALYRYVANRAALLDGVAESTLGELVIATHAEDWREQLRSAAHDFRRLALAHPNVVPLLVTRPLATPLGLRPLGTLRLVEQILDLLITAGFTPIRALQIYRAYFGLLCGHVLNELQEMVVKAEDAENGVDDSLAGDAGEGGMRLGLDRLPAGEFLRLRSVASELFASYDGAAQLDQALDLLFIGMVPAPAAPLSTP